MTIEYPVAGRWTSGESSREVRSPFDDAVIAQIPSFSAADVDAAVEVAQTAMRRHPLATHERAAILDRAAVLLAERLEDIAADLAREAAKPIKQARRGPACGVHLAILCCRGPHFRRRSDPHGRGCRGADHLGFVLRVPIGVVGAITPFNFPLNLVAHKIGPCDRGRLCRGQQACESDSAVGTGPWPRCCSRPVYRWSTSVVPGPGSVIGDALVRNDDVEVISFTGSPEVGWSIRASAPRKRVGLELGNNSPLIIRADGDWRVRPPRSGWQVSLTPVSPASLPSGSWWRIDQDDFVAALVEQVGSLVGRSAG